MYIFLDDYRNPSTVNWVELPSIPNGSWTIVRSYDEFKTLVENLAEAPAFIAFDHDLAEAHYQGDFSDPNEKTGYDCAKFLVEVALDKGWTLPDYAVHSLNPSGKANIQFYLTNAKRHLEV